MNVRQWLDERTDPDGPNWPERLARLATLLLLHVLEAVLNSWTS
ncbi:hypothetical protein [Dactylosporangium sp. CA-233914]